jgi:hypothetical protein
MKRLIELFLCVAMLGGAGTAAAQTSDPTQEIAEKLRTLPSDALEFVHAPSATLLHREAARGLLTLTLKARYPNLNLDSENTVCLIHVLRWTDPAGKDSSQTPEKQNWYVYSGAQEWDQSRFAVDKRILGNKDVWLLYVHLNRAAATAQYKPDYEVVVTKKAAANVAGALQLVKLFPGGAGVPDISFASDADNEAVNLWGGEKITIIKDLPADIKVTPRVKAKVELTGTSNGSAASITSEKIDKLGDSVTFDDEGKAFWDVSVGFPIRGINDLKFDDATHQATVKTIDRSSVVALVHLYLPRVDLKSTTPAYLPRPIVGIDISDRPLNKLLVGGAVGTPFATFYMAGVRTRIKDEAGKFTNDYRWQFTLGVSLPVKGAAKLLQAK